MKNLPELILDIAIERSGVDPQEPLELLDGMRSFGAELAQRHELSSYGALLLLEEFERAFHAHEHARQVEDRDLPRGPIVVAGLPRTGTTLLHNLLALSAEAWVPRLHRLLWPGLPEDAALARTAGRMALVQRGCPGYLSAHPVSVAGPAECINAMVVDGRSALWDLFWDVPRHLAEACDNVATSYPRYLSLIADQIAHDGAADRIPYLKSPYHSLWINDLLKSDPRIRVVYVNRDHSAVYASWLGLIIGAQEGCLTSIDAVDLARAWISRWEAATADLERLPADRVMVLDYSEIGADPIGTSTQIALWAGESAEAQVEAERRKAQWLNGEPPTPFSRTESASDLLSLVETVMAEDRTE